MASLERYLLGCIVHNQCVTDFPKMMSFLSSTILPFVERQGPLLSSLLFSLLIVAS